VINAFEKGVKKIGAIIGYKGQVKYYAKRTIRMRRKIFMMMKGQDKNRN
jgi:hypothetical protein